jgi:hypothetical protein
MVVTTLDANISAASAAIPPTSNGTVLSTPVKPVTRLHLDMLHKPVKGMFMMMKYVVITTLKENMMENSPESVEQHELFVYIHFSNHLNSQTIFLCHNFPFFTSYFKPQ